MAVANYLDQHRHYPPAYVLGPDGRPWHSWRILILPFISEDDLFKQYRFDEPWDGPRNRTLAARRPKTYAFPTNRADGSTLANYLAVVGPETMWPGSVPYRGDPPDGTSSTALIVENDGLGVHWLEPRDLVFGDMSFALQNPNGISSPYRVPGVAMADGAVRSLGPGVLPEALRAALTAAGGEKLSMDGADWTVIEDGRDRPLKEP